MRHGHELSTTVAGEALRMVQHWGLASVDAVADRTRAVTAATVTGADTRRILSAVPLVHWLDGTEQTWFSLFDRRSGLTAALAKVFFVTSRVSLGELRGALAKSLRGVGDAPT